MKRYTVYYTISGCDTVEAETEEEALENFEINSGSYDIDELEAVAEDEGDED